MQHKMMAISVEKVFCDFRLKKFETNLGKESIFSHYPNDFTIKFKKMLNQKKVSRRG
jgi:hypothetical protein